MPGCSYQRLPWLLCNAAQKPGFLVPPFHSQCECFLFLTKNHLFAVTQAQAPPRSRLPTSTLHSLRRRCYPNTQARGREARSVKPARCSTAPRLDPVNNMESQQR